MQRVAEVGGLGNACNGRIWGLSRDVTVMSPEDAHCSTTMVHVKHVGRNRQCASSGDVIMHHIIISESGHEDKPSKYMYNT